MKFALLVLLFVALPASAQDIITQTNTTMLAMQPAIVAASEPSKPKQPPVPLKPRQWVEKVPGHPEAGLIEVTAVAPEKPKPPRWIRDVVRVDEDLIAITLTDTKTGMACQYLYYDGYKTDTRGSGCVILPRK